MQLSSPLAAGAGGPVAYELRQGSVIRDDCLECDRAPIVRPLQGTFLLALSEGGDPNPVRYDLTAFAFRAPLGEYAGSGSGTYTVNFGSKTTQTMELTAEVNGVGGIQLTSGVASVRAPWPAIDIEVTELELHDPNHVYTLRIVAAPEAKLVPYALKEGSALVRSCTPLCRAPDILIPLEGTFLLGEIAGPPNPTSTYRLDAIDFHGTAAEQDWLVTGAGIYRQGGEVALLQEMELEATVNERSGVRFKAPPGPVGATFPEIDIELEEEEPPFFHYSLHIVAKPSESPPPQYRRGDSNADGSVNVTDGVDILSFLFANGVAPGCFDAADADDDDNIDVSDTLYLLFYLFLDGSAPPSPGPERCGLSPTPSVGCESYAACGN